MKKTAIVLLCLIMMFTFACCLKENQKNDETIESTTSAQNEKPKNILKIGVFETLDDESLPGELALDYARSLKKSVKIGQKDYSVKLVYADSGTTKESALEAAKKLVSQKVSAVIAGENTQALIYAAETFQKAGIAVIEAAPHPVKLSGQYSNIFNLCLSDLDQAKKTASFASKKLKTKKAYILCKLGDETSVSRALYFKEAAEGYGIKCTVAYFEENTLDMSEYVTTAKDGKYDLFYAPIEFRFCSDVFKESRAAKATFKIIGLSSWSSADASKYKLSVYAPDVCSLKSDSKTAKGYASWLEKSENKNPMCVGSLKGSQAMYADAYNLALKAVKVADSTDCAAALKQMKSAKINGLSGTISFTSSNINKSATITVSKLS